MAVDATNTFRGSITAPSGTTTVAITATDGSGNQSTATYEVDQETATKTFTYDANGNLTSDGTRTFEWDARNQLLAVNVSTHGSEFTYDGKHHRVRVVEKESSVVQSDTKVIWCQTAICEERAADGVTVTRRLFVDGEQVAGVAQFFASDHLGSLTEVTDALAGLVTRYAFDPWGRRIVTSGVATTSVGFTGHEVIGTTGLALALYRAYDAERGSWISEDPLGINGDLNLYSYSNREPIGHADPTGLVAVRIKDPLITDLSKSKIGGCGKTLAHLNLSGECKCADGKWRASLSISLTGENQVANDTLITP